MSFIHRKVCREPIPANKKEDRKMTKERMKREMRNLQELTGQESGIVIYDGKGILCNWSSINGFPHISAFGLVGFDEEIPEVVGEHMDISSLLEGVSIEISAYCTDEELPKSGTVYRIGDIIVIAPDDWV